MRCSLKNMPEAPEFATWIAFFAQDPESAVADAIWPPTGGIRRAAESASADAPVAAKIVTFDEKTGKMLTAEKEYPTELSKAKVATPYNVPWKDWLQRSRNLGGAETEKAHAVAALQLLHENMCLDVAPVAIILEGKPYPWLPKRR